MIIRIAELEIDPAQLDTYRARLGEQVETAMRLEPGVLFLYVVAVKGAPASIRVLEGYADEAAYQAHLNTEHFTRYKTETAGMVRDLKLIETEAVAIAAKDADFAGTGRTGAPRLSPRR